MWCVHKVEEVYLSTSSRIQGPEMTNSLMEFSSIFFRFERIRNTILSVSSFSPRNVIVHRHEDDPSLKLLWFTLWFRHHLWNLRENSQRSESWENCPLELHRLAVDLIQIFEIACFQKPFGPVFPGFDWLVTEASQTEHRVGKDMGFGIRNMNSSITQQRCFSPYGLLPINRGQSGNFCLIVDQPLRRLK